MKVTTLCVLVSALAGGIAGELATPDRSYQILMLLPVSTKSHRNIFMSLAEALADRGHKIVMLTNHPKSSKHPSIQEVPHGLQHIVEDKSDSFNTRKEGGGLQVLLDPMLAITRDFYGVPVVKQLYRKRKEFDLIVMSHSMNEMAYPFLHEVPFITIVPPGMNPHQSAVLGNVLNPAYFVHLLLDFPPHMTFWQRFLNMLMHVIYPFYWRTWMVMPMIQREISRQFPKLPSLLELEGNVSLTLLNSHFSINTPLPLLPSQVEIGTIHCRPANSLPQEVESWITGAGSEGVIYFSLGSFTSSKSMPVQYRDLFVQAFHRLPQRIIWKYEGELEGVSDNVMISKWLPQQDILAHDNVKVFISHGGLLSLQESIYHSTPLLVLPILRDQPKNGKFVKDSGLGQVLAWEDLTVDVILDSLTDVITNPKYKINMAQMSVTLRDQLTPPKERAVFWTEYVIRHRGAPHLRSPAAQLSWVEFLMLDMMVLLCLVLFLLYFILRWILRTVLNIIFSSGIRKKNN